MMPIENILCRNLDQLVLVGTFLFKHSLHAGVQVAGPRNHWPDQGPSNGAVIFYDAGFSGFRRSSEAVGLSYVSFMVRQLTGQISAHYSSSKIRNTNLRLFFVRTKVHILY